jgi:hypothetical protein
VYAAHVLEQLLPCPDGFLIALGVAGTSTTAAIAQLLLAPHLPTLLPPLLLLRLPKRS